MGSFERKPDKTKLKKDKPAGVRCDIPNNDLTNLNDLIANKINEAVSVLDVTLDVNDPGLKEQLTLGDSWDDPFALTKAMDKQPIYYSRWATLLRKLKRDKEKAQSRFNVWESIIKNEIAKDIFDSAIADGMTANNAKPTNVAIDNKFNELYVNESSAIHYKYEEYRNDLDKIEKQMDVVEIVVKAFEQRKDMLISLSSLVRGMADNQLLIYRKKNRNNSKDDDV